MNCVKIMDQPKDSRDDRLKMVIIKKMDEAARESEDGDLKKDTLRKRRKISSGLLHTLANGLEEKRGLFPPG